LRYRPFGPSATVVSAVSLTLGDDPTRTRPSDWVSLIYAALENGINAFEVIGRDPVILDGVGEALQAVERRLVFLTWRLGTCSTSDGLVRDFSGDGLTRQVCAVLARTGLDYLDVALLDDPLSHELPQDALAALTELKAGGAANLVGVAGEDDALDAYISTGAFDVLACPFNLTSGWKDRNRVRTAVERDMAVIGYRAYPEGFHRSAIAASQAKRDAAAQAKKDRAGPLTGMGSYAFLDRTPNWDAEEICLAYALTEPALATVEIRPGAIARMEQLASVADREMPPGLAAQIEMARFAPETAQLLKRA
jgi:aryl-alcohol dehydrogenase-like predicted oxidoreductase